MPVPDGRLVLLVVWATFVGLDLVSAPQIMVSRPLVVGVVTGLVIGDARFGLAVGIVLELFALESLAVGAARYPDYGAATVGAVVAGTGAATTSTLGISVVLGLLLASAGGRSMQWLRRANAVSVGRRAASLMAGDPTAVRVLLWIGLSRDTIRSLVLALVAVGIALLVRPAAVDSGPVGGLITVVVLGGAFAAGTSSALRSAGRGPRLLWLGIGLVVGATVVAGTR